MTTPRLGVGVASLGGYLYAVGGSDGDSPLASTERLVPHMQLPLSKGDTLAFTVAGMILVRMNGVRFVPWQCPVSTWEQGCWMAGCMQWVAETKPQNSVL